MRSFHISDSSKLRLSDESINFPFWPTLLTPTQSFRFAFTESYFSDK